METGKRSAVLGVEGERIFRAVKHPVWYHGDRYMSYICPNPQNVQHKSNPGCKLWTLGDYGV